MVVLFICPIEIHFIRRLVCGRRGPKVTAIEDGLGIWIAECFPSSLRFSPSNVLRTLVNLFRLIQSFKAIFELLIRTNKVEDQMSGRHLDGVNHMWIQKVTKASIRHIDFKLYNIKRNRKV